MQQYKDLVQNILENGEKSPDRTGTGTRRIFGTKMEFDCSKTFPVVTVKKTFLKGVFHELLWFLRGETNIRYLNENGIRIWDEWADYNGELGPIYGSQWRNAGGQYRSKMMGYWVQDGVDQLGNAIHLINHSPHSRRIIVDSWSVDQLPDESITPQENVGLKKMALAPCHMFFQFFVNADGTLDIQAYQRSVDVFLGLPFNIASYATLLAIVAKVTGKKPGRLIWLGGDTHIYNNHMEQVEEMLKREPLPLPTLHISDRVTSIDDVEYEDIHVVGYQSHDTIKAEISV